MIFFMTTTADFTDEDSPYMFERVTLDSDETVGDAAVVYSIPCGCQPTGFGVDDEVVLAL